MRVDLPSEIPLKSEKHTLAVEGARRRQNPSHCKGLGGRDTDNVLEVRANGTRPHVLRKPRRPDEVDTPTWADETVV